MFSISLLRSQKKVPHCLATFGIKWAFSYLNHPGVMAVATLVDHCPNIMRARANFTQEHIEQIREYDIELARKAQIALDHDLAINFLDLERIEETLPRLLREREQLAAARKEIMERKVGDYGPLKTAIPDCRPENWKMKMPDAYNTLIEDKA